MMSNRPNRGSGLDRGSGLALPPHVRQQQGEIPPDLMAALQGNQPTREEQARAAGIQLALAFNEQRAERADDATTLVNDARLIADFLTGGSAADNAVTE